MADDPIIFLSYARPDQARIEAYYTHIKGKGFSPWMDKFQIKGGQNWDFETKKALKKAAIVVLFLSNNSVNRRGYVQREVKLALKQYETKLIDDIYIVPVAIDPDLPIPGELEDIHVIRAESVDSFAELTEAISHQLAEMGTAHETFTEQTGIKWYRDHLNEFWEGLPGYDLSADVIRFSSLENAEISRITDILRGWTTQQLLSERRIKFDQSPDFFNFGQERYRRTNSWEAHCGEPIFVNRVISLVYSVWWYGAGAAHPNSGFQTFNFVADPLVDLGELRSIFLSEVDALPFIQQHVREQVLAEVERGEMVITESLKSGTGDWDCFQNFAFTPEGLMILIPPYQIAPYAAGSFHVVIDYKLLKPLLVKEIIAALGIEYVDVEKWPFDDTDEKTGEGAQPEKSETLSHAEHIANNTPHLILPYED